LGALENTVGGGATGTDIQKNLPESSKGPRGKGHGGKTTRQDQGKLRVGTRGVVKQRHGKNQTRKKKFKKGKMSG